MNGHSIRSQKAASVSSMPSTALRTWLKTLLQAACIILLIYITGLYVLGAPARFIELKDVPSEEVRALAQLGLTTDDHALFHVLIEHIGTLIYVGTAIFLFWRKPNDWMVLLTSAFFLTYQIPSPLPGQPLLLRIEEILFAINAVTYLVIILFPDGRFVPRWTRWPAAVWVGWALLRPIFPALSPENWPAPGIGQGGVGLATFGVEATFGAIAVVAQIYRYRHVSTPIQRQQTKWVVFGFAILVIGYIVAYLPEHLFPGVADPGMAHLIYRSIRKIILLLTRSALPITVAIAILRYRLWDIDLIINRTLVYGTLTTSTMGLYVLVVGSLGSVFQTEGSAAIPFFAAGVMAVIFEPLRERLQRGVNRLMYGERDEPYAVLSRLGKQLESALEPSAALPLTVETVAQALKLPYAAIALKDTGKIVATYGDASHPALDRFPLAYSGETIGELLVAPRAANEPLSQADRNLLNDLAKQISIAAHATVLSADLERARLRIVTAREEARRKLGSDLHDGVGHQLAGLARKTENAANLLERDPAAARIVLTEVTGQLNHAITQVRNLAHQLHPPELELLGLVGALRERAQMQNGFMIYIDAPESLPALPTAIETAAYYIALEALTNIEKHAKARAAHVWLALVDGDPSTLEINITDDGCGLPAQPTRGLGLLSMQARAAEVGGICQIESNVAGGTRVRVSLPVSKE